MRRVFHDPQLEADFEEYGFVVVPFLEPGEVQELVDLYWQLGPAPDDPRSTMYFDFQSEDAEWKREMVSHLRPYLEPRFKDLLDDFHLFYPNYIMKWPGDRSGFAPHQDTSLVDEDVTRSITIWSPLTDTVLADGRDNGMLYVVPGSHKFAPWIRAHDPGAFAFAGTEQDIIDRHGVGVRARAGEAIVFDHRLVHFSMPNESTEARLVIALGLRPGDAQLTHYRRGDDDGTFEAYAIDDDYFIDLNPFSVRDGVPGYEQVATLTAVRPALSAEEFAVRCAEVGPGPVSARDRMVADANRPDQVNADPFCFRCGATDGLTDIERAEHGNVQYLCTRCRAEGSGAVGVARTLRDPDLEDHLDREGYAVVDVDDELLAAFDELWARTRPDELGGFHTTTQTDDPDLKRAVHAGVCDLVRPVLGTWFAGHRPVAGNFVVKQPGPYVVQPHQDLDFVDEARFRAVVVWVPLQDAAVDDGALAVVPGSQRLPTLPRGSGDHAYPFGPITDHLRDHASVPVPVRRGQAVVYDARTIHGSGENRGDRERVAVAFAAVPDEADLLHVHLNPDGTAATLRVDDEIYADTRFHGFPVRGEVVSVHDLPPVGPYDVATADRLLAETGAAFPARPEEPTEAAEAPPTDDPAAEAVDEGHEAAPARGALASTAALGRRVARGVGVRLVRWSGAGSPAP